MTNHKNVCCKVLSIDTNETVPATSAKAAKSAIIVRGLFIALIFSSIGESPLVAEITEVAIPK